MHTKIPSVHIMGSRLFGGAEHFYLRLLRILRDGGHPVTAINRPHTPVATALASDAIKQIHFPMANGWDLWSLWRIRETCKGMGPCIVQTYMGRATRLTRLPSNSPAIHIARLGEYYKIDGYYRHAHAWIANTHGICDYLVKSGLPARRVFYIGNFVPDPPLPDATAKAEVMRQYGIPQEAWVFFGLGRLVDEKGFDVLLRAMALLPGEIAGRPLMLLIAGDGPSAPRLQALTQELGLQDRVRWLGWQNDPNPFYSLADVFISPARHEALGNIFLEAWSHGLPIVSTMSLGATELLEQGVTGLLCPCGEPKALAGQMSAILLAESAQRKELGEAGRALLRSRFSAPSIRDAYLTLYAQLMAERGD
jgi:glycosyltransferase involved in cell wall biosynthesis